MEGRVWEKSAGGEDRTWRLEKILLIHSQTLAGAVGLTWTSGEKVPGRARGWCVQAKRGA